jgi:hypothetical protein
MDPTYVCSEDGEVVFNNPAGLSLYRRTGNLEVKPNLPMFKYMKGGISESMTLTQNETLSGTFGSEEEKTYCLKDLFNQSEFKEGLVTAKCLNEDGYETQRLFEVKKQDLIFDNKMRRVITLHEVTRLYEN